MYSKLKVLEFMNFLPYLVEYMFLIKYSNSNRDSLIWIFPALLWLLSILYML